MEKENYDMFLYGDRERGEVPNGMVRGGVGVWAWHKEVFRGKDNRL